MTVTLSHCLHGMWFVEDGRYTDWQIGVACCQCGRKDIYNVAYQEAKRQGLTEKETIRKFKEARSAKGWHESDQIMGKGRGSSDLPAWFSTACDREVGRGAARSDGS